MSFERDDGKYDIDEDHEDSAECANIEQPHVPYDDCFYEDAYNMTEDSDCAGFWKKWNGYCEICTEKSDGLCGDIEYKYALQGIKFTDNKVIIPPLQCYFEEANDSWRETD